MGIICRGQDIWTRVRDDIAKWRKRGLGKWFGNHADVVSLEGDHSLRGAAMLVMKCLPV